MRYTQTILWFALVGICCYLVYDVYALQLAKSFGFGSGHVGFFVALISSGALALYCFVKAFESLPETPPHAVDADESADDFSDDEDDDDKEDADEENASALTLLRRARTEVPPDADDPGL